MEHPVPILFLFLIHVYLKKHHHQLRIWRVFPSPISTCFNRTLLALLRKNSFYIKVTIYAMKLIDVRDFFQTDKFTELHEGREKRGFGSWSWAHAGWSLQFQMLYYILFCILMLSQSIKIHAQFAYLWCWSSFLIYPPSVLFLSFYSHSVWEKVSILKKHLYFL